MLRQRNLRSPEAGFILSEYPCFDHLEIPGSRLPTHEQVLLCFLANLRKFKIEQKCNSERTISKIVVGQVLRHYEKAGICTIPQHRMEGDIEILYSDFRSVCKSFASRSNVELEIKRKFLSSMPRTMPFWSRSAVKDMERAIASTSTSNFKKESLKQDLLFLKSMMSDRMESYEQRKKRHQVPNYITRKRKKDFEVHMESTLIEEEGIDSDEDNGDGGDQDWLPKDSKKEKVFPPQVSVFLRSDFANDHSLLSMAIREKISADALSEILCAFVQAGGGDPDQCYLTPEDIEGYMNDYKSAE